MTVEERARRIKLLLFDVDGVLTDGVVTMHADGSESKGFNIKDGAAIVWAQRAEVTGAAVPAATAAGVELTGLVLDVDATVVVCHSEKEQAAATFKHTFGYHPILAFLDNSGEFLAGLLRPGNAGANTAADHIAVLDAALEQIPDAHRHGLPVLIRTDGAGCSKAFLAHIRSLR